ncbi:MAG: hypothetical protein R3C03_07405 [Pirellulaceae bacterium]
MKTELAFSLSLTTGQVVNNTFSGWKLELVGFKASHEIAVYQLKKNGFPNVGAVFFWCWPLPFSLTLEIDRLVFETWPVADGKSKYSVSEANFCLQCDLFGFSKVRREFRINEVP